MPPRVLVERIKINGTGLTITYERSGSGPLVVLLHGGLSDHREWRRQLDGLSDAFTVVAWDAPGCGGSSDPPVSFRMSDYADVLAGFVATLDLGRPSVVGLSWGSTLALELYRRHPTVLTSLVLTAAYAGWAGSLPPEVVAERIQGVRRGLELPPEEWVREWIPTLFTDRAPDAMVEEAVAMMCDFHPGGVKPMLEALADADLRGMLGSIDVPTLLLYGEEDVRSPLTVAEELHRGIRGSELVVLPEVGHQCNIEAADRFNTAVRGFLTR
ncbi:MAG: alpha/beta hydrolase [Actinomycetota bacterium]